MRVITALTRGYKDISGYATLIERNKALDKFFNGKYPLILFHEGNISSRQQRYIADQTPNQRIEFLNIADRWQGGYEGMCRFHMWDMWEVCQHYEMVLRVDEDCIISEMATDPFEMMGDNVYLKSCYWGESHSETNATLPQEIENLTQRNRENFYNNKFVYTNVSLARPSFWRSGEVGSVLKALSYMPDQRKNRWGDLPVLGSLLNIYAKDKVGTLTGMKYFHGTHNVQVVCG
jgi:hypothetical protein